MAGPSKSKKNAPGTYSYKDRIDLAIRVHRGNQSNKRYTAAFKNKIRDFVINVVEKATENVANTKFLQSAKTVKAVEFTAAFEKAINDSVKEEIQRIADF